MCQRRTGARQAVELLGSSEVGAQLSLAVRILAALAVAAVPVLPPAHRAAAVRIGRSGRAPRASIAEKVTETGPMHTIERRCSAVHALLRERQQGASRRLNLVQLCKGKHNAACVRTGCQWQMVDNSALSARFELERRPRRREARPARASRARATTAEAHVRHSARLRSRGNKTIAAVVAEHVEERCGHESLRDCRGRQ